MKPKTMVAGAIAAAILICVTAAVAYSLASHGQQSTHQAPGVCSVNGYVVSSRGQGLSDLNVTLCVLGRSGPHGDVQELYNMTTKTEGQPNEGRYAFDSVAIPEGTEYAYVEAYAQVGETCIYGRSNNFTLTANGNVSASIVLKLPPPQVSETSTVKGQVVDSFGNGLPGVNATLYVMGSNASSGAPEQIYNITGKTNDRPNAGLAVFDTVIPPGTEYAYIEAIVEQGNITYLGRSDNFTLKSNDTVNVGVVIRMR